MGQKDETEARVQGVDGSLCAPKCPKDKPPRTLAFASCMLQDQTGDKYCALTCFFDFMCPKDSKCGKVGGLAGVCYYPETASPNAHAHQMHKIGHNDDELVV